MVPADNCGNDGAQGLFDRFGVVFRGCCHEPKVLRVPVELVQRKGVNVAASARKLVTLMADVAIFMRERNQAFCQLGPDSAISTT